MRGVPNAPAPSLTLGLLGPSHQWCHKSRASLRGPPCAHGVAGTPQGEVRDTRITWALSPMVRQVLGVTPGSPLCPWCCGHSSRRGRRQVERGDAVLVEPDLKVLLTGLVVTPLEPGRWCSSFSLVYAWASLGLRGCWSWRWILVVASRS